eukprot:c25206_g1_i1 orf=859-2472(+)
MDSELIVLSSDDEDEIPIASWLAKSHKRSTDFVADNDVTVIEKVPCLEGQTIKKSSLGKPPCGDDDCCILNHDPENNVHVPDFQANDADDLVVVGERGPVACRDFPHARHLCVKFPFTSTSHEKYCEQCHCYVCDIVAPCLLWGQGKQSSDHCHASDKNDKWIKMRTHARSLSTKFALSPLAPIRRGLVTQPQRRTYTQAPLRVTLTTTGFKSSANHTNSSVNRGIGNISAVPGTWQPYVPSKLGTRLPNGSYGNRVAPRGTNTPHVGDPYPGSNVVPPACNITRGFSECNTLATGTSRELQQMSHQPSLNSVATHDSIRITQTGVLGHGAMPDNTYASTTNFTNPPVQQYQGQRDEVPSLAPCNYMEGLGAPTQGIPVRPHAASLSNLGKDLMTLQSFLMEGISGQSQGHSTSHGTSMAETGCVQSSLCLSGGAVSKGSSWGRDLEGLYNPFEPSEMPACNNAGVGVVAPQTASTHATVQNGKCVGSMSEPTAAGSKEMPEQPDCGESGTVASSALDQLLADFDDDFWTFEPTTFF